MRIPPGLPACSPPAARPLWAHGPPLRCCAETARRRPAELVVTHLGDAPPVTGVVVRVAAGSPGAEEQVWAMTELLKAAAESGELGTWYWDIAEGLLVWSPEMYAIHGVTEEGFTLTPESALAFVSPLDRAVVGWPARSSCRAATCRAPSTEWCAPTEWCAGW